MSAISRIDPFPRVDNPSTPADLLPSWGPVSMNIDGVATRSGEAAGAWDRNSNFSIHVPVSLSTEGLEHLRTEEIFLSATLSCRATCRSATAKTKLARVGEDILRGEVTVELLGSEVDEELVLEAVLVAAYSPRVDSAPWLRRRVVASMESIRVVLGDEERGFPTSAVSFDEQKWPDAPWRILVDATDPADSFSRCVRLYLNQDMSVAKKIIEEKASDSLMKLLQMSIVRALLEWASRVHEPTLECPLDETAAEHPDSVAAAARRSATQHLGYASLNECLEQLKSRPDSFEMQLMSRMEFRG